MFRTRSLISSRSTRAEQADGSFSNGWRDPLEVIEARFQLTLGRTLRKVQPTGAAIVRLVDQVPHFVSRALFDTLVEFREQKVI